jgi:hypothetical protein
VKFSQRWKNLAWASITAIILAAPLFWVEGGCGWLQTKVFPPRRLGFMPANSVWIEAPSLPISWHHGWWFGCGLSPSGTANYCRLTDANGPLVYGGEYMSCGSRSPIAESDIRLLPPPPGGNMWLFAEGSEGVVGFLADGDLLLPVSSIDKCGQMQKRLHPPPQ